jgi:phosphoglycerate dehydrogenase-like enzyme
MTKSVLITDLLFIEPRHEKILTDNGFSIERLDKPNASEEELVNAVKGKDFYILGGIEKVTEKVISAADNLKAIVFTGTDYVDFIPGHEAATKKGIAIANAPGANAIAVADHALTLMLAMNRNIFALGRGGDKSFHTAPSIQGLKIGIIGLGTIGKVMVQRLKAIGVKNIFYFSRQRKPLDEASLGIEYLVLPELLKTCDMITIHTPKKSGCVLGDAELSMMKKGAIIINCAHPHAVDSDALIKRVKDGALRAAYDAPPKADLTGLSLNDFYSSNDLSAYNTTQANALASDMSVQSLLNIAKTGNDKYLVNPEYKK